jgi:hypothetical protein
MELYVYEGVAIRKGSRQKAQMFAGAILEDLTRTLFACQIIDTSDP